MPIPSKTQVAANQANAATQNERAQVEADVKYFTDAIVGAMNSGQNSFSEKIRNVSPEVETRLKADFGKESWTLSIRNARTGCNISWS
jgi:hypothetical protein